MTDLANVLTWIGIALVGLVAVIAFVYFRDRFSRVREQERMADASFEAQMLALTRSSAADQMFIQPITTHAQEPASYGTMPAAAAPLIPAYSEPAPVRPSTVSGNTAASVDSISVAQDPYMEPADRSCAKVLSQLQHAGLLEGQEGFVDLYGNTKGAVIVRIRGGKRCLVVPNFESEAFTMRNSKRYDMIIYLGKDGKAVTVSRLEDLIANRVSGAMM